MEILVTAALISYVIYLRYYADLRTKSEKEIAQLQEGIQLFNTQQFAAACTYFDGWIRTNPSSSVAYLYRARCQRQLGNVSEALKDLKTGLGYDDTVVDLHLELGELFYEQQSYDAAFIEFDKAVFHSHGNQAEPFHWRGLTFRQLHQPQAAQQDLDRAQTLARAQQTVVGISKPNDPFFDRKLLVNSLFILINSLVLLFVVKETDVVHWPYLLAAISAAAIGFAQPRKGWLLAILQAATLLIGYFFFAGPPQNGGDRELELFSLYGSIGLTFVGSFVGGVLKRALGS